MIKYIISIALLLVCVPSFASINGINQFPTPQVLPSGTGTISYQQQNTKIGNQYQGLAEYGLNSRLDIAGNYGFSPNQGSVSGEFAAYQGKVTDISVGFLDYASNGAKPKPFGEVGFTNGRTDVFGGYLIEYKDHTNDLRNDTVEGLAGISYTVSGLTTVQVNYQAGSENFIAAGFKLNIARNLSVNPAVEWENTTKVPQYYGAVTLSF